jgi:site-specific recombinase XerD
MVRPYPGYRIEEVHADIGRMADQGGNVEAMLAVPDRKTRRGRSEYALLLFLYNTGARVSEATHLKVRDLQIGRGNGGHDLATLHGKGGKTRQCPLWPETERVLADESTARAGEDAVFISRLGTPFARFGVYRLIERCAAGCRNWRAE